MEAAVVAIDRILCAVDLSDHSRRALEYAVAMGAHYEARVTALHVYANVPTVTTAPFGLEAVQVVGLKDVDPEALRTATADFVAKTAGGTDVEVLVVEAFDTAAEVVVQAQRLNAGIVVVGSHGRSRLERLFLGSVAYRVLRTCTRPVLVVPPHADDRHPKVVPFKRIICPIDFSDSALRALEYALHLAEESDGHLTLVHAIELPPELHELPLTDVDVPVLRRAAEAHAHARLETLIPEDARQYCRIDARVVEGRAHRQILSVAADEQAELIVMGVQGRGTIDVTVFGSNTQAVVRGATCPVLTVRS
jgi:nucleotide-binding universal stress UspA family protein